MAHWSPPLPRRWPFRRPRPHSCLFRRHPPPSPSIQVSRGNSPCEYNCSQLSAPAETLGEYGDLAYGEFHNLCPRYGSSRKASVAAPETRSATLDAVERKRGHRMVDTFDTAEDLPVTYGNRRRAVDLHLAFVVEKVVVEEDAQWWNPEEEAHWDATRASLLGRPLVKNSR